MRGTRKWPRPRAQEASGQASLKGPWGCWGAWASSPVTADAAPVRNGQLGTGVAAGPPAALLPLLVIPDLPPIPHAQGHLLICGRGRVSRPTWPPPLHPGHPEAGGQYLAGRRTRGWCPPWGGRYPRSGTGRGCRARTAARSGGRCGWRGTRSGRSRPRCGRCRRCGRARGSGRTRSRPAGRWGRGSRPGSRRCRWPRRADTGRRWRRGWRRTGQLAGTSSLVGERGERVTLAAPCPMVGAPPRPPAPSP